MSNPKVYSSRLVWGFSIVELLLVLAITAFMASVVLPGLYGTRGKEVLNSMTNRIVADLRNTSERARAQESGIGWGIRFTNPVGSGNDYYEIWSGADYASGTKVAKISLSPGLVLTDPADSKTKDIIFSKATGLPTAGATVAVFSTALSPNHVGIVDISSADKIDFRIASNLQGYWDLDEATSTTAYDASGNNNNGTFGGSPTWQSGSNCKIGSCLSFGGSGYFSAGTSNTLDLTNNFTIATWVKVNANGTPGYYILTKRNDGSLGDNYALAYGLVSLGASKYTLWSDFTAAARIPLTSTVTDTNWHHVAYTYDGTTVSGYLDGVLDATSTQSFSFQTNTSTFRVGTSNGSANLLNGSLDDIQIYNKALSATDVADIYNMTNK